MVFHGFPCFSLVSPWLPTNHPTNRPTNQPVRYFKRVEERPTEDNGDACCDTPPDAPAADAADAADATLSVASGGGLGAAVTVSDGEITSNEVVSLVVYMWFKHGS